MCFSPEASFTAATVLTIIGLVILRSATKPQVLLACIPLFFAIQQASEGVLWLVLQERIDSHFVGFVAKYVYLFFAYVLWPFWIPLAIYNAEVDEGKKKQLLILLAMGMGVSLYCLFNLLYYDYPIQVFQHSIQYSLKSTLLPKLIYSVVVIVPCLISSYRHLWIFGLGLAISFVVAEYFYQVTFASVWCFLAAILSVILYKILKENRQKL